MPLPDFTPISAMVAADGEWEWSQLHQFVPHDVLEHIACIKPPFQTTLLYSSGWLWCGDCGFSVKSSYDTRYNYPIGRVDNVWSVLKKFLGVPRVKSFLWLVCKGCVLTNFERARQHLIDFTGCVTCCAALEDLDHLLRLCPIPQLICSSLVRQYRVHEFFTLPISVWVRVNFQNPRYFSASESDWDILFGAILWNLWLFRNRRIFDPESDQIDNVMSCSRRLRDETCQALASVAAQPSILVGARPLEVTWCPPSADSIKVNVDYGRRLAGGVTPCGGVAELWAVYEGLKCAMSLNVQKLIVKSDSREVIGILSSQGRRATPSSLLESIRALAAQNCEVVFQHVFREGNRVADAMTHLFSMDTFAMRLYLYPPYEVLEILHADVCS
ncbi:hypothetical protein V6N12_028751 [Hibiscus sabdariffa]|uniref:RNase H type-1 domain-containing protein n=1 Tax=Hibiscus sabdariffa TaxID=183260 RepID=A0ABR2F6R9_9ROSI